MDEPVVGIGRSDPYLDDYEKYAVAKAIGMDKFGDVKKNQHQIERLIEWAHQKGAKDTTEVINNIQHLASRLGSPKIGNNWAQHLSQYAYLDLERMKIDKDIKSMEPEVKDVGKDNTTTSSG